MEKYLLVTADKFKAFKSPQGWLPSDWQDIKRDNISYKMVVHLDNLPDSVKNQADFNFDNTTEYSDWLASTDKICLSVITQPISNDPLHPTFTRTATALRFSEFDIQRNTVRLIVGVNTFDESKTEQRQLYREVELEAVGEFYGIYMMMLDAGQKFGVVVRAFINERDSNKKI